jgi:hypothetical protein
MKSFKQMLDCGRPFHPPGHTKELTCKNWVELRGLELLYLRLLIHGQDQGVLRLVQVRAGAFPGLV